MEEEKVKEDILIEEKIKKLQKKNFHKNIVIILLIALLIISTILAYPTAKRHINKAIAKQEILNSYNSKYKLDLQSVYGDIEAYHPKILYFEQPWNGYSYWLSYTPYPSSDEGKENPHIVASNDMIHWETPAGFKNPLDEPDELNPKKYNSDSHIVMNDDLNRLECYWRYVNDEKNQMIIYRRYTTDGVNWSEKEEVAISKNRKKKDYVSPAIIYDKGIYKIWYIDQDNSLRYIEAKDGEEWKDLRTINLEYPKELKSWHVDVIKTDEGYEMVMMAFKNWKERGIASLYYSKSTDNVNWTKCTEIIKPSTKSDYWDNRGIYRSSLLKKDGIYYVFYGASNTENIKGIGIMYGKDINNLHKVDINYKEDKDATQKFEELIEKEQKNK